MKRRGKAVLVLLLSLSVLTFLSYTEPVPNCNPTVCNVDTIYVEKTVYIDTSYIYDEAIEHLKEYEGFRAKVYIDTDGSKTIGYGHHLRKNENWSYVSEEKATDILKKDLDRRIDFVNENYEVNSYQALALGMLGFNLGTGRLSNYIKKDKLLEGDNINKILNYCHYKTYTSDGTCIVKTSSSLKERRQFELHIFNM